MNKDGMSKKKYRFVFFMNKDVEILNKIFVVIKNLR